SGLLRRVGQFYIGANTMCESKIEGHRVGRVGKRLHANGLLRIAKGRRDFIVVTFAGSQYLTPMRWGVGAVFGGVRELSDANISRQSEFKFSKSVFDCPSMGGIGFQRHHVIHCLAEGTLARASLRGSTASAKVRGISASLTHRTRA
ncbi:hypothetical protein, partial [Ralstonia solanacearum]|uniref:hypothetical protein n=1 Tax=Ralstonia solanacearum TaxID=305 RepID=UPI001E48DB75